MERSITPSKSADNYGYLWWLNAVGSYDAMGNQSAFIKAVTAALH